MTMTYSHHRPKRSKVGIALHYDYLIIVALLVILWGYWLATH